jgi:hypothetical protein
MNRNKLNKSFILLWFLIGFPLIFFLIFFVVHIIEVNKTQDSPFGYELVPTKCDPEYYLEKKVEIYQNSKMAGKIINPAFICLNDSMLSDRIILYGWIWSNSVKIEMDSTIILLTNENLRNASNRAIIAILLQGTKGKFIHQNSNKSWILASYYFNTDINDIKNKKEFFLFNQPLETTTHSGGGDFPDQRGIYQERIPRFLRKKR